MAATTPSVRRAVPAPRDRAPSVSLRMEHAFAPGNDLPRRHVGLDLRREVLDFHRAARELLGPGGNGDAEAFPARVLELLADLRPLEVHLGIDILRAQPASGLQIAPQRLPSQPLDQYRGL